MEESSGAVNYILTMPLVKICCVLAFDFGELQFSSFLKGQYSKITFRTPLYLGGAPSAYWLVRATGTNRGFQGCVQSLTVNGKRIDMRPWPLGKALSGADIGKWLPSEPGCSCGIAFLVWATEVSSFMDCSPRQLVNAELQEGGGPKG